MFWQCRRFRDEREDDAYPLFSAGIWDAYYYVAPCYAVSRNDPRDLL
jgi:hypothetical protein